MDSACSRSICCRSAAVVWQTRFTTSSWAAYHSHPRQYPSNSLGAKFSAVWHPRPSLCVRGKLILDSRNGLANMDRCFPSKSAAGQLLFFRTGIQSNKSSINSPRSRLRVLHSISATKSSPTEIILASCHTATTGGYLPVPCASFFVFVHLG